MGEVLTFRKVNRFEGTVQPPADKSLTHRAYLFAAMAEPGGETESVILDPLRGEDCENTRKCLARLGKPSRAMSQHEVRVDCSRPFAGQGLMLDCGNSGTSMRLLAGLLASLQGVSATLTGDASLSKRPMGRIAAPLREMGADIPSDEVPLKINGTQLKGIHYESPVASAQVKSCVLIAGLRAEGPTAVTEPALSRDHTERMFKALGVNLVRDGLTVGLAPGQTWGPFRFRVPGDISSAAFLMVAGALLPGEGVVLDRVGTNPSRTGILDVLKNAGVVVESQKLDDELGEPVANIRITRSGDLKAFDIAGKLVPRLIDEIPVLAVMATQASGRTVIRDAKELRVKETDRIVTVAEGLTKMGAKVEVFEDGMAITGPTPLTGAEIDAAGDHRIGMSFAIAGSIAEGETTILNADSIKTSYPDFVKDYETLAKS